ncbi:MAG: SGNH/GDSL hydrolase family protein [Thermoleophilia bacterium]|nr:SGNH/GDSL hydrolase family protein [Thermoleophilia bacterium]
MKSRRLRAAGRSGLIALVVALAGFAFFGGSAQAASSPVHYVALGDSYSAASGVLPLDPMAPPQCLRSTRNYPHVLAEKTGAKLTDVTCGAADTTHFFTAQYPGLKPQLDALKPDTELVTMTIGGNDSGVFINAILSCGSAGLSTLGMGSPCKDQYGSSFEDTIRNTTYPSLVKALGAVRDKAPKARVAILSYPWITPRTGGCFPTMPVAEGDIPYVRSLQTTLNYAVRRAAEATGVTFVSLNSVSEGHDACKPIGTRWVEPVLLGTNPVIVHPNALGESKMAEQTIKVLSEVPGNPLPSGAPETTIRKLVVKKDKRKATFRFTSNVTGSTFRCKLDNRRFRSCRSPRAYKGLKPGRHRFQVVAIDSTGQTDPTPATKKFRIVR